MKINVTSDHIRHGKRCTPFRCPVALAMREAAAQTVAVVGHNFEHYACMKIDGLWYKRVLPKNISEQITRFDYGENMHEMEFDLSEDEKEWKPFGMHQWQYD